MIPISLCNAALKLLRVVKNCLFFYAIPISLRNAALKPLPVSYCVHLFAALFIMIPISLRGGADRYGKGIKKAAAIDSSCLFVLSKYISKNYGYCMMPSRRIRASICGSRPRKFL